MIILVVLEAAFREDRLRDIDDVIIVIREEEKGIIHAQSAPRLKAVFQQFHLFKACYKLVGAFRLAEAEVKLEVDKLYKLFEILEKDSPLIAKDDVLGCDTAFTEKELD